MYSAAPSALTEQVLHPHHHSGLEHGFDAMSLTSRGFTGTVYGEDDMDEFRDDEPPLGYGIEHACR